MVTGEKMITRVRKYIRDNRMLKVEDVVVAGVSGGADSIAMLHILKSLQKEIGFSMEVVHVHHGIRGQEADRDEQFVEKICRDWGIPFRSRHYPVPELSEKWKLGEEETGRIVRKQAFQEEKRDLVFPENSQKRTDSSGLRWHIIATIWQRLCCIIWQGEPVSGDFPGYRR